MRTCTGIARVVTTAATLLLVPAAALAQAPASSFDGLGSRLRLGDTVYVSDSGSHREKGVLQELSASRLVLRKGDELLEFPADRVQAVRLQGPNPLANGALIGLGTAVGISLGVYAALCGNNEGCSGGGVLAATAMAGLMGAGIGVAIDAAIPGKKILVYQRPGGSAGVAFRLSPVVGARRQGLAATIAF